MNRRGLHHRAESVVAQRVHLAASGAEMFQFLLSRKLNLFLIVFLVTHMVPFFSVRSSGARFFLSNGTKKAPRAVRGSLSVPFDGIILSHFCKVCIRVFRQAASMCCSLVKLTITLLFLCISSRINALPLRQPLFEHRVAAVCCKNNRRDRKSTRLNSSPLSAISYAVSLDRKSTRLNSSHYQQSRMPYH